MKFLIRMLLVLCLAGCTTPAVRYADELGVPRVSLERLPDLGFYTPSPGQVILIGEAVAGSGTALRTSSHGLVVLTNLHVAQALAAQEGPVFAFWPEPERRVEGFTGSAYTAVRVRPLLPSRIELEAQVRELAEFHADFDRDNATAEDVRQQLNLLGRGLFLELVTPDLALLAVDPGPVDLDDLSVARLADATPREEVETVLIYPVKGVIDVDLVREHGTFRAAPTRGGETEITTGDLGGLHTSRSYGAQGGNSGTGVFDKRDRLCAVLTGYWDGESSGKPVPGDPRAQTRAVLEVLLDPESALRALNRAAKRLVALWRPHTQLGNRSQATLLVRLEELRVWLVQNHVALE